MKLENCTPGKRVKFYNATNLRWETGEIVIYGLLIDGFRYIILDNNRGTISVRHEMLRGLKPNKKRREFWVNIYTSDDFSYRTRELADKYASTKRLECILVREVVRKK